MKYIRITVPLISEEMNALRRLAEDERRDARPQAALLIRQKLIELGYLMSAGALGR